ncbi:MAG: hypothetical protein JKY81_01715 [Colwellia sp.]|nr:hypothetical protein [Colwellia sp.]
MTDSMQKLGSDAVKPATDNAMTEVKMVDIWSRMTPEQREVMVIMYATGVAGGQYLESNEADDLNDILKVHHICDYQEWDRMSLPFKFGTKEQPWKLSEVEALAKMPHDEKLAARLDNPLTK